MSLFLSAVTTQNILIREPDTSTFSAGTVTDLLSPDGSFTLEDIRSSSDLQAKVASGDVILTSGDNDILVNLSTAGINYFNTYDGVVSRDISVDGQLRVAGAFSGDSIYSGTTPLEQVISGQIDSAFSASTNSYFDAYDGAGGTSTTTANWTPVPMDTQRQINGDFSHDTGLNNTEVTINTAYKYLVIGRVSLEKSGSNTRTQAECRLEIDTGGGFGAVPGTTAEMYLRLVNFGATGSFSAIMDLNPGDKLRMTFRRETGSGTIRAEAGGSSLSIVKIIGGPRGAKGETGALALNGFTDFFVTGTTVSDIFSGDTFVGGDFTGDEGTFTGDVTADEFFGDGSNLTGINGFGRIDSPNGGDVIADQIGDTLNLTGDQIDITNDPGSDTIDFAISSNIVLDSIVATALSGGTIYSGGTDLSDIFITVDNNDITRVQPGTNIATGGTDNFPTISVVDSPSFNNLVISGSVEMQSFTAGTISWNSNTDRLRLVNGSTSVEINGTNGFNYINYNTDSTQSTGAIYGQNTSRYFWIARYNSGVTASYAGIPFSCTTFMLNGPLGDEPVLIGGNPIYNLVDATPSNAATRLDSVGFRVGTVSNASTSNIYDFQVDGNSYFDGDLSANTIYSGSTPLQDVIESLDTFVTGGTMSTGGTMTLTLKDGDDVQVNNVRFVPIILTYSASQALGATYATLTNMTLSGLSSGTYLATFSGQMGLGANGSGDVAMFVNGIEVGGTNGYTLRQPTINTVGFAASSMDISVHTQGLITITSSAQTIDVRGRYVTGTDFTFEGGSLIIERKY